MAIFDPPEKGRFSEVYRNLCFSSLTKKNFLPQKKILAISPAVLVAPQLHQSWDAKLGRHGGGGVQNHTLINSSFGTPWDARLGRQVGTPSWDATVGRQVGTPKLGRQVGTPSWDAKVGTPKLGRHKKL